MERFRGKRILVTGATRGIGHAVALRLLGEGATVILHGDTADAVRAAGDPLRALHGSRVEAEAANLADRAQCRALCRAVGGVDILINSAGLLERHPLETADARHWHRLVDINTTAPWILSRALLPGLRQRRGTIVNVGSNAGLLGYADHSVYCASTGALIGLTRALAVELAPDVRVLCVCPGPVQTEIAPEAGEVHDKAWDGGRDTRISSTLLNRSASPEETAAAIVFAASADCSFAAGNLIVLDGGATAGRRL